MHSSAKSTGKVSSSTIGFYTKKQFAKSFFQLSRCVTPFIVSIFVRFTMARHPQKKVAAPPPSSPSSPSQHGDDDDDMVVEVVAPPVVPPVPSPPAASPKSAVKDAAAPSRARRKENDDDVSDAPIPKKAKKAAPPAPPEEEYIVLSDDDEYESYAGALGDNLLLKAVSRSHSPPMFTYLANKHGRTLTAGVALCNALSDALWMPEQASPRGSTVDAYSHLTSSITSITKDVAAHYTKERRTAAKTGTVKVRVFEGLAAKVNNAITQAISPLYLYKKIDSALNLLLFMPTLPVVVVTDARFYHGFAVHGCWIYDTFEGNSSAAPLNLENLLKLGYLKSKNGDEDNVTGSPKNDDPVDLSQFVVCPTVVQYAVVSNKDWVEAQIQAGMNASARRAGPSSGPSSSWLGGNRPSNSHDGRGGVYYGNSYHH
jgi:hypothetical protein